MLLERIKVSPYPVDLSAPGKFRASMIAATKMILDDEIIVKLAMQKNLETSSYVTDQSRLWHEYIIFQTMRNEILHQISDKNKRSSIENREDPAKLFDDYMVTIAGKYDIRIFFSIYDTLRLEKTDMAVIKNHFPKRSLIPLIQPLPPLPRFDSLFSAKLVQN